MRPSQVDNSSGRPESGDRTLLAIRLVFGALAHLGTAAIAILAGTVPGAVAALVSAGVLTASLLYGGRQDGHD